MLAAYFIVWDRDNRVANFSSYRDAFKTTYTYNTTDELTAASSAVIAGMTLPFALPTSESYNLDLDGNRRTSGGVSQSANGTQNQLQTDGTYNYTYDNEGNITRRTVISTGAVTDYAWDHRNRLASVFERPSAAAETTKRTTYVYDAFDRRVGKRLDTNGDTIADQADAWIWDGQHEVIQYRDVDGAGATQSHRLLNRWLFGAQVDQVLSDEQYAAGTGPLVSATTASATTGNTLWTLTDHLGSVRDVADNNGVVRQHLVFDSFGRRTREVDYDPSGVVIASNDPAAIDELFAFTGRDWDSDVGLQYNRARWYDPATGRWLSRDPIGFGAGDVNLYRYVGNGPTNNADPSGFVDSPIPFYVLPWNDFPGFERKRFQGSEGQGMFAMRNWIKSDPARARNFFESFSREWGDLVREASIANDVPEAIVWASIYSELVGFKENDYLDFGRTRGPGQLSDATRKYYACEGRWDQIMPGTSLSRGEMFVSRMRSLNQLGQIHLPHYSHPSELTMLMQYIYFQSWVISAQLKEIDLAAKGGGVLSIMPGNSIIVPPMSPNALNSDAMKLSSMSSPPVGADFSSNLARLAVIIVYMNREHALATGGSGRMCYEGPITVGGGQAGFLLDAFQNGWFRIRKNHLILN